jgi:hypothetical protein
MLLDPPHTEGADISEEETLNPLARLPKFFRIRLENIKNQEIKN